MKSPVKIPNPPISIFPLLAALLLIALSGLILYHFCLILIHGQVIIYEHSKLVVVLEIVLLFGCFLFGLERLWASLR